MTNKHKAAGSPAKIAGKSAERARSKLQKSRPPKDEKRPSEKKREKSSEPEKQKIDEPPGDTKNDNVELEEMTGIAGLSEIRKDTDFVISNADKRIWRAKRTGCLLSGLLSLLSAVLLGFAVFFLVNSLATRKDVEKRFSTCSYQWERALCAGDLCDEELIVLTSKECCAPFFPKELEWRLATCDSVRKCEGGPRKCLNGRGFDFPIGKGEIGYFRKGQKVRPAGNNLPTSDNSTTTVV